MTTFAAIYRTFLGFLVAFSLPLAALLINPWSHTTAQVMAHLWIVIIAVTMTMKRQPCYYGNYAAWYRDRANWWKAYP